MITKTKKSISLSVSLLEELEVFNKKKNFSDFIEMALIYYLNELKKAERGKRDIEIIKANAKRFRKEATENLMFQAPI